MAGCSGGGRVPSLPTISDARIVSHDLIEQARMMGEQAPVLTHPTSITQSSTPASVSTTFDGNNVELTIDRQTGSDFTLHSATHSVTETLDRSRRASAFPISGHTLSDWTLFDSSRTGTSSAHVTISWNNSDPTDYLAGGYWMHLSGDLRNESISSADIGAFVTGPEFSSVPTLPVLGTATYRGYASGLFTTYYGPAWQQLPISGAQLPADGTKQVGVFTGIIELTANFETNMIGGCLGCLLPGEDPNLVLSEFAGETIDPNGNTGELFSPALNTPGRDFTRIIFGDTPIEPNGTFVGNDITVEVDYIDPLFTGSTSSGTWGGKFSSIPDEAGDPRLVGGTFSAEWANPAGGRQTAVGNFFATTPE